LAWGLCAIAGAEEPISFVLPAANFQPVAADAYPADATLSDQSLATPANSPMPTELASPEGTDTEIYFPTETYEPLDCPNCNGGSDGGCGLPPGRLPNGQYPDDWMWGCGQWPYANGPGTCDDWKVGPIWDVTVDGMVMTRPNTNLGALENAMPDRPMNQNAPFNFLTPDVTEQFDRGPGGRVYLTGLLPKNAGYQMFAGYEGIEEWNASIVYPEVAIDPPPAGDTTERRSLYYRSSLHSGELNFLRMCDPAWRPYCGVRYMKFDDEIWDQNIQNALPPLPGPAPPTVTQTDTYNIFDVENNLIGFQGGLKYDIWQVGKRFSLQGFINGGVYYNRVKWSNLTKTTETQFTADDTSTPVDPMDPAVDESSVTVSDNSGLTIAERSDVSFAGEASLTGVCRLNKCWACRAGYQVLFIDGVQLASDAYLNSTVEDRSLLFHGWHAGVECRR
jgi:hypothetical protein